MTSVKCTASWQEGWILLLHSTSFLARTNPLQLTNVRSLLPQLKVLPQLTNCITFISCCYFYKRSRPGPGERDFPLQSISLRNYIPTLPAQSPQVTTAEWFLPGQRQIVRIFGTVNIPSGVYLNENNGLLKLEVFFYSSLGNWAFSMRVYATKKTQRKRQWACERDERGTRVADCSGTCLHKLYPFGCKSWTVGLWCMRCFI